MILLCTGHRLARRASISLSQQSVADWLFAQPLLVGNGGALKIGGHASVWCREAEQAAEALVDMAGKRLQNL